MSGSTIGGVVGGVIGLYFGNPQLGWMTGSAIGGYVDPDQIEGPRLSEANQQTAQDGIPLIDGYGTFPAKGNLIWTDEVVEHRNKESSKGGPEQVSYTYTVSYAIVVCKGPISGYKIIKRNGKIVYDARTDAELTALGYSSQDIAEARAAQAQFLRNATLYYGAPGQMPDPTMVAVKGAGNVPAYTGIAYIVLKDDETREGEVAQYEFVVAACGERSEGNALPATLLVSGTASGTGAPVLASADAAASPSFSGIPQSSGADLAGCVPGRYLVGEQEVWVCARGDGYRYSIDGLATWQSGTNIGTGVFPFLACGPAGILSGKYAISGSTNLSKLTPGPPGNFSLASFTIPNPVSPPNPLHFGAINMARYTGGRYYVSLGGRLVSATSPDGPWTLVQPVGFDGIDWIFDILDFGGERYIACQVNKDVHPLPPETRSQLRRWNAGDERFSDVLIDNLSSSDHIPWQLEGGNEVVVVYCYGGEYVYQSGDGFTTPIATGIASSKTSPIWTEAKGRQVVFAAGRFFLISGANPSDTSLGNRCVSTVDGLGFTAPVPLGISNALGIAASSPEEVGFVPIPDAPGFYIDTATGQIVGPPGTQIDPCAPTLGSIVADQCERRGVTSRDVSELTETVLGYRVAAPSTPQKNIQGLQPGYLFVASEFDGVLHFAKRGRDLTFALTMDDFVEREGDPIQWERTQERDFARKVTVAYADPETSYSATTQQAERRAATIAAEGETTIELPVTGTKDWAAQVADKSLKIAYGEPDECTFHVSIDHADLVTGAEGTVPYTDGEPTAVRIERIEDEGLVRMVTARKTRRSLYESNASGASKPLPRFPGSNIRGPTDGVLLNIPVLIDADDRPGIHWAASRMLSGWQGTQLQIRRAGQWTVAGTASNSAGMGTLLDPLPAHAGDVDTANVLRVRMNEDVGSVTWVNLLRERNPFAILRDDGTAEIIQAQTATAIAPGEFELTTLLRGRLATTPTDHAEGARIVFLDDRVLYASLEPTDVGQTIEYRFVSIGTDPDTAPIQTITLTTMESQREWPVAGLTVEKDGDDYTLTWLRRDRLGTDVLPIRSANWAGYDVSYSHAGGSGSVVVTTETHTFTLPGASDITFRVAQLNQFTGEGPAKTVTIP